MTQREKVLATTLVAMVVVIGGGFVFHMFVYQPLSDVRQRLDTSREQLAQKQSALLAEQKQIEAMLRVNPRLKLSEKLSLPPRDPEMKKQYHISPEDKKEKHIGHLEGQYEKYLSELMIDAEFQRKSVIVKAKKENRVKTAAKGKEPPYERLVFTVEGRGTVDSLQKAMKAFHQTPLLHSVRNMTLTAATPRGQERLAPGTVDVNMIVEALMLKEGEERTALLPYKLPFPPTVLAQPGRDYALMHKQNMFAGVAPLSASSRPSEERREVLRFVKLTTIFWNFDRKRWEATIYDQNKGGAEKRVNTRILNEFKIQDRHENTMLEGKVVLIDETQLIFQADGKFYRMHCGDFMDEALKNEVEKKELVSLGLAPDA